MSDINAFEAVARDTLGKGGARALRREKMVPIVVYGAGKEAINCAVPAKELHIEYNKVGYMSKIYDLKLNGKTFKILPKAIQLHPVTDFIEHADFTHVDLEKDVKATVSIKVINRNKCAGLKLGGILNIVKHELQITAKPNKIPTSIEIDIQNLRIGNSIHVGEIPLPEGCAYITSKDLAVVAMGGRASKDAEAETSEVKK